MDGKWQRTSLTNNFTTENNLTILSHIIWEQTVLSQNMDPNISCRPFGGFLTWGSPESSKSLDRSYWNLNHPVNWTPVRCCGVQERCPIPIHLAGRCHLWKWWFPEMGAPLVIIHFNDIFPFKPTIFGITHLWKPPNVPGCSCQFWGGWFQGSWIRSAGNCRKLQQIPTANNFIFFFETNIWEPWIRFNPKKSGETGILCIANLHWMCQKRCKQCKIEFAPH